MKLFKLGAVLFWTIVVGGNALLINTIAKKNRGD